MNGPIVPVGIGFAVGGALIYLFLHFPIIYDYSGSGSETIITLQRTACFGDCPVYALEIHGNGFVIFRHVTDPYLVADSHIFGIDVTRLAKPRVYQISQEEVNALVEQFYTIGYLSMNDTYIVGITDLSATITSLTVNGTTKSVYNYLGGPRELFELEYKIDEIARTRDWVEDYDNRIIRPENVFAAYLVDQES